MKSASKTPAHMGSFPRNTAMANTHTHLSSQTKSTAMRHHPNLKHLAHRNAKRHHEMMMTHHIKSNNQFINQMPSGVTSPVTSPQAQSSGVANPGLQKNPNTFSSSQQSTRHASMGGSGLQIRHPPTNVVVDITSEQLPALMQGQALCISPRAACTAIPGSRSHRNARNGGMRQS